MSKPHFKLTRASALRRGQRVLGYKDNGLEIFRVNSVYPWTRHFVQVFYDGVVKYNIHHQTAMIYAEVMPCVRN